MRLVSAEELERSLPFDAAVDALERALRQGLDPERDAPRSRLETTTGELLLMPSALGQYAGTKVLSSTPANRDRGLPLIQGGYVLFEGPDQRPVAVIDGAALTNLRTPAVSALALRHLAGPEGPERLTVFGTGTQARVHVLALRRMREIGEVALVGRNADALESLARGLTDAGTPVTTHPADDCDDAVAGADLICTCTAATDPLFDGRLVRESAVVVAMGSHHPESRETDDALVSRADVVIESRASVLREAGDVIVPLAEGLIDDHDLVTLVDVVAGQGRALDPSRPTLFKFTGMPWEDLVVAAAAWEVLR